MEMQKKRKMGNDEFRGNHKALFIVLRHHIRRPTQLRHICHEQMKRMNAQAVQPYGVGGRREYEYVNTIQPMAYKDSHST